MKRIIALAMFIMALLALPCNAEEFCETPLETLVPQIRIGETTFADVASMPDAGTYWKVYPMLASTVFEYEDGASLDLTYKYYNGDYYVTTISLSSESTVNSIPAQPVTCPGDIMPGSTTLEQLEDSADLLGLTEVSDYGDSVAADITVGGISYCVWFEISGDEFVCSRLYITDRTAALENICGAECTDYTIADFRELRILETGYAEVTNAFPGYTVDMVDNTFTASPVKSIIYLLSDYTHLTLEFMEFDGEWRLAGVCWMPEDEKAAGISPNPDDGKKYTKAMYAESLDWLTVGCTTYTEVDKRYMDHWGLAVSQNSIDFQIQDENGNSVDLFFMSIGDDRVLYAMRYFGMFGTNIRPYHRSAY